MADVLVVDDSGFHRRLLSALLAGEHEVADTAASGVEAVDRHAALDPDVVVMGWDLPIRDGLTAAGEIGDTDGETGVILFGTAPTRDARSDAAAVGVDEYLVVPIRRRGLLDAVERVAPPTPSGG